MAVAAAALAIVSMSASGCVSLPQSVASTKGSDWTPASTASMQEWVKRYDRVSNHAGSKRDPRMIERVEAGILQRASKAAYTLSEHADPQGTQKAKASFHTEPKFYLPKFDEYPLWFMADSVNSETKQHVLDLAVRSSAGGDWRKLLSVPLDDKPVPKLAMQGDKPVMLEPAKDNGLLRPPAKVARAFGKLLTESSKSTAFGKVFSPHSLITGQLEANFTDATAVKDGIATLEHTARPVIFRVLKTEDGGALMIAGIEEKKSTKLSAGSTMKLGAESAIAVYTGKDKVTKSLKSDALWQVAMALPPKGAADQTVQVLGMSYHLINAEVD